MLALGLKCDGFPRNRYYYVQTCICVDLRSECKIDILDIHASDHDATDTHNTCLKKKCLTIDATFSLENQCMSLPF